MSKLEQRPEAVKEKRHQMDAQIQDLEARKRKQDKMDDARRKILVGAMVLAEHDGSWDALTPQLDGYLHRPRIGSLSGLRSIGRCGPGAQGGESSVPGCGEAFGLRRGDRCRVWWGRVPTLPASRSEELP